MPHAETFENNKCMRHALWTRLTAKSAGVSEIWFLRPGERKEHEKEATTTIIILAFYFIDPFPIFW